jgi:hypothetical protein
MGFDGIITEGFLFISSNSMYGIVELFVARETKCTIAQINAPVFQCEGVVGLLVA